MAVESIKNMVVSIPSYAGAGIRKGLYFLKETQADPMAVKRALTISIQAVVILAAPNSTVANAFLASRRFTNVQTTVETLADLDATAYFLNGNWRKKRVAETIGTGFCVGAGFGGLASLLDSFGFVNLEPIGAKMAQWPVFNKLAAAGVTLGTVVTGGAAVAFTFFAISALQDVVQKNGRKRTKAFLKLAWSVSEVALCTLALVGSTATAAVTAVTALTFVAAGTGLAYFFYSRHVADLEARGIA